MAKEKRSLFEWLTGSTDPGAEYSFDDLESGTAFPVRPDRRGAPPQPAPVYRDNIPPANFRAPVINNSLPPEEPEGELSVDVYQTGTHIIIKAMIAGVRPDNLDVTIGRDMVTIRGKREAVSEASGEDYYYQELYWGAFSRSIALPQEIDPEGAEASEKHGLLIVRLPKLDKRRQMKLKVRSN